MSMTREAALFISNHQTPITDTCWWCGWIGEEHYNYCPLVQANEVLKFKEPD